MKRVEEQLEKEIEELKDHVKWLKYLIESGLNVDWNELLITEDMIELKTQDLIEMQS